LFPRLWRDFRLNLSANKASKQYYENRQSNNRRDSDTITLRRKRKPIQAGAASAFGGPHWPEFDSP
jgi:hypothetical protein